MNFMHYDIESSEEKNFFISTITDISVAHLLSIKVA